MQYVCLVKVLSAYNCEKFLTIFARAFYHVVSNSFVHRAWQALKEVVRFFVLFGRTLILSLWNNFSRIGAENFMVREKHD